MSVAITPKASQQEMIWQERVKQEILPILPPSITVQVSQLPSLRLGELEEIRIRQERTVVLRTTRGELLLPGDRRSGRENVYRASAKDIQYILQVISKNSVYALEEEFKNGYLTIRGGHRIGLVGEAVLDKASVKTLKHIASLNIRVAREVKGCADKVMSHLVDSVTRRPRHTLIISPPRCGKTTLLRDITRQLSEGIPGMGFSGLNVGLVDERSEIAGCFHGVPQNDVGNRTDVLDKCPKAQGLIMLVRSMSPEVIATDELGKAEDFRAVEEVLNAGITLIATVHGANLREVERRPGLHQLVNQNIFQRYIILGRSAGPGTVEDVIDGRTRQTLLSPVIVKQPN